jgi:DNA-binding XRE family transcriptional regulator
VMMIVETAPQRTPAVSFSPKKMKQARRKARKPAMVVALEIGRTLRSLERYEAGTVTPPLGVVCAIAVSLGVPVGDLFE